MIVLKHLAREYNKDPHFMRRVLRDEYGFARGRRWQWDEKKDKVELARIRKFLSKRFPPVNSSPKTTDSHTSSANVKSTKKNA